MEKILITAPRLNNGGVNVFVKSILPFFEGISVFYRGRKADKPSLIRGTIDGFLMPFRFLYSVIVERPDKIIVNTSLGNSTLVRDGLLVFLSKILKKKVLLIIHGFEPSALKHTLLLRCGYFKADAIIVLASAFKELIIESGYKRPVYTQYNPVDKECFEYIERREKRDFTKTNKILFLARIEKAKGIYEAIDAFKIISSKHNNVEFSIVGDGSELDNVRRYIEDNKVDKIQVLGFKEKEDKYAILVENDFFFFSSYKEGLPICVLEAMAAGQLVLTRPVGGLVDLYGECPFGEMVDSLEPSDFADAYEKYARNIELTESIRKRNQAYAQNFRPSKIVDKIQNILKTL